MFKQKTAVLVVLDAVGLSTIEYLLSKYDKPVHFPNLLRLGLGNTILPQFKDRVGSASAEGYAVRLEQASASADSVIGHREMMGIVDDRTFNLFPDGFPKEYLKELEKRTGRKTFFNQMAGGVEAIELNDAHHEKTGEIIVYASKCDPLIQIAMREDIVPVAEQHKIADMAFDLAMEMNIPITRAIARAYIKKDGEFIRTANRHDAVLPMEKKTLVDILYGKNVWTVAVGKTADLVNTKYHAKVKITDREFIDPALGVKFVHPKGKDTNPFSLQGTVNAIGESKAVYKPHGTFIFSNFVDADSLYGHTRDVEGSIKCIEEADRNLPIIEKSLSDGDLLIITADHGMAHKSDYGYHSKEALPFFVKVIGKGKDLGGLKTGKGKTLGDAGYILSQYFGVEQEFLKESGLESLVK